jgi:hypothetical protein
MNPERTKRRENLTHAKKLAAALAALAELPDEPQPLVSLYLALGSDARSFERIRAALEIGRLATFTTTTIHATPDGRALGRLVNEHLLP